VNANDEKLLRTRELARRLAVGQDKVRDMAREGLIPSVRVGANGLRFDWDEVIAALRANGPQERTA
jgi:excisionase family DNA binding protein